MSDKPILFSAPMVAAILRGDKTQTRRVIKPQPIIENGCAEWGRKIGAKGNAPGAATWIIDKWQREQGTAPIDMYAPYQVGDMLWVRETYAVCTVGGETLPVYRADSYPDGDGSPWKPSIFMPRWASRITLHVTNVRAQRVQDISEDDAAAEGIERHSGPYILDFAKLWDSINEKRGHGWSSNPWVWAYTFEVVQHGAP